jgi:hypothetical protein
VARISFRTRRQITRNMHQTRDPLFVTATRGNTIVLLVVGVPNYTSFIGRKAILRHISGRIKPPTTSQNIFGGRMERRIPQTNNKIGGTWTKGGLCQTNDIVAPRIFFHHCKLSGHWEMKFCEINLKIHPRNHKTKRRV